jgi:hypothetical protein
MEPGRTMIHRIWRNASGMESPGKMRIAPAPMMMSGDGMGTMICSIITPMKTASWPWVLINSIIHWVISDINGISYTLYFITSDKNPVKSNI